MLENRGSLVTGKAGAASAVRADVLSGEWLVEEEKAGKTCQELAVRLRLLLMLFHSIDAGFWRDLLNHILSSVTFPRYLWFQNLSLPYSIGSSNKNLQGNKRIGRTSSFCRGVSSLVGEK